MPPSSAAFSDLYEVSAAVEREIVAEHDEAMRVAAQQRHQGRQALDVLAMDFDQLQRFGRSRGCVDRGVRGLHQRGLAHAARAPEQRVVGGQAFARSVGVLQQRIAHPIDAAQQRDVDAIDLRHRLQRAAVGVPDEGVGGGEVRRRRRRRGEPLQRLGDAHHPGVYWRRFV